MRLLLIEPDRVLASIYQQALGAAGHEVRGAVSAQSAVFSADERTPDIVVLELQLVSHSGIEFLYEFRSYPEWQTLPVIILSQVPASEFSDSRKLLRDELGVVTYLYKPHTSLKRLVSAVSEFATTSP